MVHEGFWPIWKIQSIINSHALFSQGYRGILEQSDENTVLYCHFNWERKKERTVQFGNNFMVILSKEHAVLRRWLQDFDENHHSVDFIHQKCQNYSLAFPKTLRFAENHEFTQTSNKQLVTREISITLSEVPILVLATTDQRFSLMLPKRLIAFFVRCLLWVKGKLRQNVRGMRNYNEIYRNYVNYKGKYCVQWYHANNFMTNPPST